MKQILTIVFLYATMLLAYAQPTHPPLDSATLATKKEFTSIEEALKTPLEVYKLNLSGQNLKELPISIAQLRNLETFDCSDNQLTSLPREIGKLTNLKTLFCFFNQLTTLPKEIGNLTNLIQLYCSSNQLTTLLKEIAELKNLTKLDCNSNRLTTLPKEIGELKNLTELECAANKLTTLPKEIENLTKLTKLDYNNNQLTSLPKEIGELKNLTTLYCHYNQLTTLPKEISKLRNLTALYCNNNPLTILPKEIGELKNLTALYCCSNQLTTLPKEITELKNLTYLDCSSNQLTTLPKEIAALKSLTKLDCSSNQLTSLPKEIGKLTLNEPSFKGQKQADDSQVDLSNMYILNRLLYLTQQQEKDSIAIYQKKYTQLSEKDKLSYLWSLCKSLENTTLELYTFRKDDKNGLDTDDKKIQQTMQEGVEEGRASAGRLMQALLQNAVAFKNKDNNQEAVMAYFMGVAHKAQYKWKEATMYYEKWLALRKKEGDKKKIGIALKENFWFTLSAYNYYQRNPTIKIDYPYITAETHADEYLKNAEGELYEIKTPYTTTETTESELIQEGKKLSIPLLGIRYASGDTLLKGQTIKIPLILPKSSIKMIADSVTIKHSFDKGETLESIAKMYGISAQKIIENNPTIKTNQDLKEGQELKIIKTKTYIGQAGDTWRNVAERYKIDNILTETLEYNKIKKDTAYSFNAYNNSYYVEPVAGKVYTICKIANTDATKKEEDKPSYTTYITSENETLESIKRKYRTRIYIIEALNNTTILHEISRGQTLATIAKIYNVTAQQIIKNNLIEKEKIKIEKEYEQVRRGRFIGNDLLYGVVDSDESLYLAEKYWKLVINKSMKKDINDSLKIEIGSLQKINMYLASNNTDKKTTYKLSTSFKNTTLNTKERDYKAEALAECRRVLNISLNRKVTLVTISTQLRNKGFWKEAIDMEWYHYVKSDYTKNSPDISWFGGYIYKRGASERYNNQMTPQYEEETLYRIQKIIDDKDKNYKDSLDYIRDAYESLCLVVDGNKFKEYLDKLENYNQKLGIEAQRKSYYLLSRNLRSEYVMRKWIDFEITQNNFKYDDSGRFGASYYNAIKLYLWLATYGDTRHTLRTYKDLLLKAREIKQYAEASKRAYSAINTRVKDFIDAKPVFDDNFDYNKNFYTQEEQTKIGNIVEYFEEQKGIVDFLEQWLSEELSEEQKDVDRQQLIRLLQGNIDVLKRHQIATGKLNKLNQLKPKKD